MPEYGVDKLEQSVVRVIDPASKKPAGSGFFIRSDGYLITCHHVIYRLNDIAVEYQGQEYKADWIEQYSDPEVDIAILKIEIEDAATVEIVNPTDISDGSTGVTVYGFPSKQEATFPRGFDVFAKDIQPSAPIATLKSYGRLPDKVEGDRPWNRLPDESSSFRSHRLDAHVDSGTSGGVVYSEALGGAVGVIQSSNSNTSYVIRWDNIRDILDRLGLEPEKNAVCRFLDDIEDNFKYIKLFHTPNRITLSDQYIPIQVTLERKYKHEIESSWSYAESEAELTKAYALKGEYAEDGESKVVQVDWNKAKEKHNQVIVLADPGMGKSTLLRMEAVSIVRKEKLLLTKRTTSINDVVFPVLLRLSELAERSEEIIDLIPELLNRDYPKTFNKIAHIFQSKIEIGKCVLLLDALDEVPKDVRNNLGDRLGRFTRNYPCNVYCTSRLVGYGGLFLDGAKEVEIVPFNQKQIEEYINTWFSNAAEHIEDDSVSATGLIRELRNKPQIRGLTQNPLLLSLLCSLYQTKELVLPARRAEIYTQAVDYMLGKWIKNRNRAVSEVRIRAKKRLLEQLAYQFSRQGKEIFTFDELFDLIENYLQEPTIPSIFKNATSENILDELSEQDGIIQKLSRQGDKYLFLHRTFQEYLTASYVARSGNYIEIVKEHLWDFEWHEIISLVAGLLDDPIPLVTFIYESKDDIFENLLILAGKCIIEYYSINTSISNEVTNRIYDVWTTAPITPYIKSLVVSLLQSNPNLADKLYLSLKDNSSNLKFAILNLLSEIRNPELILVPIEALKDCDSGIRSFAADVLGAIGDSRAVIPLIDLLKDTNINVRRAQVRISAVYALGEIGDSRIVAPLIDLLIKDSNSYVRRSAVDALVKIGDSRVVEPLIDLLKVTLSRKNGHSARVENTGECSNDKKSTQAIYSRAKGRSSSNRKTIRSPN
jgi:energy-coupling factor transporter ATP-binding protein EcfA2